MVREMDVVDVAGSSDQKGMQNALWEQWPKFKGMQYALLRDKIARKNPIGIHANSISCARSA